MNFLSQFLFALIYKDEVLNSVNNDIGLTEFLIAFSIIMLMLSFVSERVSNFLKLHFQNKSIWIPYPHFNKVFRWGLRTQIKILGPQSTNRSYGKGTRV